MEFYNLTKKNNNKISKIKTMMMRLLVNNKDKIRILRRIENLIQLLKKIISMLIIEKAKKFNRINKLKHQQIFARVVNLKQF